MTCFLWSPCGHIGFLDECQFFLGYRLTVCLFFLGGGILCGAQGLLQTMWRNNCWRSVLEGTMCGARYGIEVGQCKANTLLTVLSLQYHSCLPSYLSFLPMDTGYSILCNLGKNAGETGGGGGGRGDTHQRSSQVYILKLLNAHGRWGPLSSSSLWGSASLSLDSCLS